MANTNATSSVVSFPQKDYPWTQTPLIVSAPMGGFATAPLATSVSIAGGIGLIGAVHDMNAMDTELSNARRILHDAGMLVGENPETSLSSRAEPTLLPIGIGFLLFLVPLDSATSLVRKHRPAIVWLSFPRSFADFATWASAIRSASPTTKIWIMVGSVASAVEVVALAKPDVLVMQGGDAGGHGFEEAVGIVSLVPETVDALAGARHAHVPILAAGGVADGRGIAAAMALGAQGVIIGTRFLASEECVTPHPAYRDAIVAARDGGQATVRAKVFDELRGENVWPVRYDGRAIRNQSWRDQKAGLDIQTIRKSFKAAEANEDGSAGYGIDGDAANSRIMIWAGAGVGLVNKVQSSREMVLEMRNGARLALDRAKSRL